MSVVSAPQRVASRNLQKHRNPNPLHQWLLQRFHHRVATLVSEALAALPGEGRSGQSQVTLLDAGCGEGFVTAFLAGQFPMLRVLGIEPRPEALAYAREQLPTAGWLAADIYHLPLADSSAPIVLCLEVLEHLERPWEALEELQRVCSGALVLSVPNQPYFALANLLRLKNLPTLGDDPEHASHWRGSTFLRLAQRQLQVDRAVTAFPWIVLRGRPLPRR